jgi:hypothetical protein
MLGTHIARTPILYTCIHIMPEYIKLYSTSCVFSASSPYWTGKVLNHNNMNDSVIVS